MESGKVIKQVDGKIGKQGGQRQCYVYKKMLNYDESS